MVSPNQIRVIEERYQDLLAEAARARLVRAAIKPAPVATPRPVARLHAGLRQAVASLVALAAIV